MAEITLTFPPESGDDFYTQHFEAMNFAEQLLTLASYYTDGINKEERKKALQDRDGYFPGLIARRFGYKFPSDLHTTFYNTDNPIVLQQSSQISDLPRNKNELAALFGLIAYGELENRESSVKDLIETYIKPLLLKYINGEARNVLQVAANKTDGETSGARSATETNQRSKNIDA